MKYISTRGGGAPVDFLEACLAGLAPDGGLFVPETYPKIAPPAPGETYVDTAARILGAFAGDSLGETDMLRLCTKAYEGFAHRLVAPLVEVGPGRWMMQLHEGPTLAFKDVAMQFIARLYDHALAARGETMTIVCATSGDTGGAAAAAFAGLERVRLVILHPHERISPVQRLFMTTTGAPNVTNLAVEGDFDACQAMVKQMFADREFADRVRLSGVNSINWARIAAQSVYYARAQAALGAGRALQFIVPSGNMGDALAGYVAARCGLLDGFELVCAVNDNRALAEALEAGRMRRSPAVATPSPAMDITVPSNLERVLFEASGRDSDLVSGLYGAFAQSGEVALPERVRGPLGCMGLSARSIDAARTHDEIRRSAAETGWLVCPHTAVGMAAARETAREGVTQVVLATAHAAKFPETIEAATGRHPNLPERCAARLDSGEVFERVPSDLPAVRDAVERASVI
ncbi:MAG: threonine synthase [Alphaproteobacteria bacterium]|nr:threonine synthase [Alphaproteobacteria bacterium]